MGTPAERDAIAALADKAWPYFRDNDAKWRGKPVTSARLALTIENLVLHLRADKRGDTVTSSGLTVYRDDDGIHVTIEVGTVPLG
jgi:RNA binding exosome subunit